MAIPQRIIIVGSGVFGLSTAYHMSRDVRFATSEIILLDTWDFEPDSKTISVQNPGAANADTSRIIRLIYPTGPYAALALEAMQCWRAEWGQDGRYTEQRLLFAAEGSSIHGPQRSHETINYIKDAYSTSCQIAENGAESLEIWDSLDQIRAALHASSISSRAISHEQENQHDTSLRGFISNKCGWANSGASIEWLRQEVIRLGRVQCRVGEVQNFTFSSDEKRITGVQLQDEQIIQADLTIVAAGCHSSRILGIPEMCIVESTFVAYIQLSEAESKELKRRNWPLIINVHRGIFCIGPDDNNCIKLGKCSTTSHQEILRGTDSTYIPQTRFLNPVHQPDWNDSKAGLAGEIELTSQGDVVDSESMSINTTMAAFRAFLHELLGPAESGAGKITGINDDLLNDIALRPFARIRRCWYNDTPTYDFIVDFHPSYANSLFVASGGCDHAFKFLPVLGEKVVAIIVQHLNASSSSAAAVSSIEELSRLWRFPAHLVAQKSL